VPLHSKTCRCIWKITSMHQLLYPIEEQETVYLIKIACPQVTVFDALLSLVNGQKLEHYFNQKDPIGPTTTFSGIYASEFIMKCFITPNYVNNNLSFDSGQQWWPLILILTCWELGLKCYSALKMLYKHYVFWPLKPEPLDCRGEASLAKCEDFIVGDRNLISLGANMLISRAPNSFKFDNIPCPSWKWIPPTHKLKESIIECQKWAFIY